MPMYEYICRSCGLEFEEIQKFSDSPIQICPKCQQNRVVKKVSLTAFQLKGEGWYKDGYSRPSETPKKAETKASTSDSTPKKEKKETKKDLAKK